MNKKWINLAVLALPLMLVAQTATNEPISITADSATSDIAKGLTVFSGNVDITQGVANLKADRVEVKLDENNRAKLLIGKGKPAKFVYKGKKQPITATANRIEYRVLSETIVMTGNAVVKNGKDVTQGKTISYNLKKELVEIEKVRMTYDPATKKSQ